MGESYSCASGGIIAAGRHRGPQGNQRITIWGQSNAIGRADRADISVVPLSSDAGLSAFDSGTFSRVYIWTSGAYEQLTPATNNGAAAGQFGAEFGLAVRWMRETTSGNLYIDKDGSSGVSITYFDPTYWIYTAMVNAHNAANAWLAARGISVTDAGWVWIQGETDYGQSQAWYETRLNALIDARTADGVQAANTKRLLMQMVATSSQYGAGVAAAKAAIAAGSPSNTLALSMPPYMKSDNLHQNGRGQLQAGYDAFEKIFSASHISV